MNVQAMTFTNTKCMKSFTHIDFVVTSFSINAWDLVRNTTVK